MNRAITPLSTLIILLVTSTMVVADDHRPAMAQERMQQTIERLELTDEQIEQATPVFEKAAAARQAILSNYGIDPESNPGSSEKPGLREMRAMRKEMNDLRNETVSELEQILSDEQLEEFKRIQQERQAEMRERMRGAR